MGVVYGAGSMWQWALRPGEPGHEPYFLAPGCGWREALDFEGSRYIGLVGRILDGLPTTDMQPDWESFIAPRGLAVEGELHIVYLEAPRRLQVVEPSKLPGFYTVVDPRSGAVRGYGECPAGQGPRHAVIDIPEGPSVVIFAR